jgi:hypothetical protein
VLYEELSHTCSDGSTLPDISQLPNANAKTTASGAPSQAPSPPSLPWLRKILPAKRARSADQRRYLLPWDKTVRSTYLQLVEERLGEETGEANGTITLPPLRLDAVMTADSHSPPIDPGSTLVLKHSMPDGIENAFMILEVSCCQLTSLDDIPTIHASVRCTPSASERVSFAAINFNLVDGNRVLDLWPREASGPSNSVGMRVKDNEAKKGSVKGEVAFQLLHLGGQVEKDEGKEVESNFITQAQTSVNGVSTGTGARWVLMENHVLKRGLPIETPLRMRVRYKPREIRYEYAITVTNSSGESRYKGETIILFP